MLAADSGAIKFSGKRTELMAEFTQLTKELLNAGAMDKDDLDLCIKTAQLSDDDLNKKFAEQIDKFIESLFKDCTES